MYNSVTDSYEEHNYFQPREVSGDIIKVRSKDQINLKAGDILTLRTAGGGGFGRAEDRDPALVERDVKHGYLSADTARKHYG